MKRTRIVPLFPLGIVVYPNELVPLHIFEPRYRKMVNDCLSGRTPFGVVLYDNAKMARIGCAAIIDDIVQTYEDGRLDIRVRGTERFRLQTIVDEGSYLTCEADWIDEDGNEIDDRQVQRLIAQHMKLLELAGRAVRPGFYESTDLLSFRIAKNAGLELQEKQQVLEMELESERIGFLIRHMEAFIPRVERVEELRRKVGSNGHFEDFPPEA